MDPVTGAIIAAAIAAFASVVSALIATWDHSKVKETHKQVTQNGGVSNPPTVLDKLARIEETQKATNDKLDQHILWHLSNRI